MKHDRQKLQDQAVEQAGVLQLIGMAAGVAIPVGMVELTFSDGSVTRMTKDQFHAIQQHYRA